MYYLKLFKQLLLRYWLAVSLCYLLFLLVINPFPLQSLGNQTAKSIEGEIISHIEELPLQQKFILRVTKGDFEGQTLQVIAARDTKLQRRDIIRCTGKVRAVKYQLEFGSNLIVNNCEALSLIGHSENLVEEPLLRFREYLRHIISAKLPEPHAALLKGMILGSTEQFPAGFAENLQRSGTLHIVSVSGFNVNFLAGLALSFAGIVKRKWVVIGSIILLLVYWVLVGPENLPATRATVSCIYYLLAQLFGLRANYLNAVGISMLFILIVFPWAVVSIGFYLSFSASLAIYALKPAINTLVKYDSPLVVLACFMGTTPWLVSIFGELNPWSVPVNILVAPFLPLIMEAAIILLPVATFVPQFSQIVLLPLESLLGLVIKIISLVENLPFNHIEIEKTPGLIISILIGALCLFLILKHTDENLAK